MPNDVAQKPKPSLSTWLVVTLAASFACMIAAAGVVVYAKLHPGPHLGSAEDEASAAAEEADLKEIDKALGESAQLLDDIRQKEQELRAQLRLAQADASVRVAAIQFVSEFGNVAGNRERLTALIRLAAGNGARVIVTPECAITGYMSIDHRTAWRDPVRRPNPKDGRSIVEAGVADTVPGQNTDHFGGLARELNIYLVIGLVEKVDGEGAAGAVRKAEYFNTAVLLGPDGKVLCHYRKLNLWPPGDATWAQPGDRGLGLCDTPYGKLGLLICYDLSSGVVPKLREAGATMVLYPVGWVHPSQPEDWFEKMLPEKVKEWGLPLIAANWSVDDLDKAGDAFGYGFSSIYAADGTILSGAGPDGSEVIYADLPMSPPAPEPKRP